MVKKLRLKEDLDPIMNTQNLSQKGLRVFGSTYRLNKDLWFGNKNRYETEDLLEKSLLWKLINEQDFWCDENGDLYIPKGTEVTFQVTDDNGRQVDLFFLNVPELKTDPIIWGWDDTYSGGDWIEEIVKNSTVIEESPYVK